MSKFLVTGGHGLIGHNVVQRLQARDETVSVVDTHTTYGIIPQAEIDYLISERLKKINDHTYYNQCITDGYEIDHIVEKEKPILGVCTCILGIADSKLPTRNKVSECCVSAPNG